MSIKVILAIVGAVAVLGTAGLFVISQQPSVSTSSSTSPNSPSNANEPGTNQPQSLKDLLSLSTPQQCSFSDENGNGGKVFIGNNKMAGDFVSVSPQGNLNSHIIIDGQTGYFWLDGQNQGFKVALETIFGGTTTTQTNIDVNKQIDFNCTAWTVNNTQFALPSSVTFSDMSAMTAPSGGSSSGTDSKDIQCAACNNAPAGYVDQCKAALGCS